MKLIGQIKYFYYIASTWGYKLAWFTLKKEIKGECKYKINTTAAVKLSSLHLKGSELKYATEYMPVNYFTIELLLNRIPDVMKQGIFLDIGCGKGRAMCVAAANGYTKVEGIDFACELITAAQLNLERIKKQYPLLNYQLHWADVSMLEIGENVSTIFLFNPFDEILIKKVIEKINLSLKKKPRRLLVLYCTPRNEELFFENGFDVSYRVKKYDYLEGIILEKSNTQ